MKYFRIGVWLLWCSMWAGCMCFESEKTFEETFDRYEEKHAMTDHFFLARSFPYPPSLSKYKQALESAKELNYLRSSPPGYDTPWVTQGPGNLGARINRIAVADSDPNIIYIGYSAGGIFKTIDGGNNWYPVFDDFTYLSIADLVLDPNDPDVLYVSTGDPNISGYPFIGDGIYKTEDGGATWQHLGLADKGIISKILVHPSNDQQLIAASMGIPFERGPSRGIYRTTDGGANWQKVLHITDSTGVIDLVMHPSNPNLMLAAGWDRVRNNKESIASGPNANIYRSTDGGISWNLLTNGLPSGPLSRTALTATSNPNIFYAQTASTNYQLEGIYKTLNAGDTWTKVASPGQGGLPSGALGGMGWYFGKFRIDPNNTNRLFLMGLRTYRSNNGGLTWSLVTGTGSDAPHVDHHDLAFTSSGDLLLATDGGLYRQASGSTDWLDIESLPMTQVYRTGYNPHQAETYYGGAQDNGTSRGNFDTQGSWEEILGADGFKMVFNPDNANRFYAETQWGNIYMTPNGGGGFLLANSGISGSDRRFWDMPYEISFHDPNTLYAGTYRVYRTTNDGLPSWSPISPSLTDLVTFEERFHVITALHPSPMDSLRLYVGTSDGNVWQTRDAGQNWENINANLPDRFISSVKASPTDSNTIFVAQSGYRDGDFAPYLYKSTDDGQQWQSISGNLPALAINDFWVLRNNQDQVLFVATDGGVYATLNGGMTWDRLGGNMPIIPVYSIVHNEVKNQVVVGTFARSVQTFDLDSIGVSLDPPPPPQTTALNGRVHTELDQSVAQVEVQLQGTYGGADTTLTDGLFTFSAVPIDSSCQLMLEKDQHHGNGVSTLDVVLVRRHILFIDTLPKPYKWIAADVNRSGTISTFDIVQMTRVILNIDTIFSNNTSWRFVPEQYVFPDDPFSAVLPEVHDCGTLDLNQPDENFIGIKVGDLNNSANPEMLLNAKERYLPSVELIWESVQLRPKVWQLKLYPAISQRILGFQGTLDLGSHHTLIEVQDGQVGSEPIAFNTALTDQGLLPFAWASGQESSVEADQSLLTIKLMGDKPPSISLLTNPTPAEWVGEDLEVYIPQLKKRGLETGNTAVAFPNPFSDRVLIRAPQAVAGTPWMLYDLQGRSVGRGRLPGDGSFVLSHALFPAPGIYLLQLDGLETLRLVFSGR